MTAYYNDSIVMKILAVCVTANILVLRICPPLGEFINQLLFIVILFFLYYRKNYIYISKEILGYIKAYGLFVLLTIPSIFFSDNWELGINSYFNMWIWQISPFLAIIFFINRRSYLVNMLTLFLVFGCFDSLYSLYQITIYPVNRGWGIGGWVSSLANMLILVLPIVLVTSMDQRFDEKLKKVANFAIACAHTGIVCNKGRGSWLTEIIVAPLVSYRYLQQSRKYLIIFIIVTMGTIVYVTSNIEYANRAKSITDTTTNNSNIARILCWKSCVKMIKDHPFTGVGPGQFRKIYVTQYKYEQEKTGLLHAHNNLIHVTVESGLIGAVGFLYFVYYFLNNSWHNYCKNENPYDLLVFSVFLGHICILGQTDYTMWHEAGIQPIMWFLIAILLRLKEMENKII